MKRFKNILCVAGPDEASSQALARAVTLAKNNQAALTLIDVAPRITAGIGMPDGGPVSTRLQSALLAERGESLKSLIEPYRQRLDIQSKVLMGTPFLEIIREVMRNGHDLVIKAPEQWDWLDRLFGSDDMHLLRKCPCPVWLIKPQAGKTYQRILAAVDVDDGYPDEELGSRHQMNLQILEVSSSLALAEFAELHVAHAWEAIGESAMRGAFMDIPEERISAYVEQVKGAHAAALDDLMEEVQAGLGEAAVDYLKPKIHLLKGWARKEIPALAREIDCDLVVMGTVARTGIPGFIMGNSAEAILSQIDCSVLAIKPPGFTSPVSLEP
jgi:nucleotide-binding universal stress UspA family protein